MERKDERGRGRKESGDQGKKGKGRGKKGENIRKLKRREMNKRREKV